MAVDATCIPNDRYRRYNEPGCKRGALVRLQAWVERVLVDSTTVVESLQPQIAAFKSERFKMKLHHLAFVVAMASLLPLRALAQSDATRAEPKVAYTQFEPRPANNWVEPNASIGSIAYNAWLGHMFNGVLFNTKDPAEQRRIAERIVDIDYIQHNRLVEHGRQGLLKFMPYFFQAMPDAKFRVHDVFATEGRVVTRWTATGTLTGQGFLGVEPKGQKVEFDGIDIWGVRNGRLYEHWDQFDWPRALIQLGVRNLPAPFYDVTSQPYSR